MKRLILCSLALVLPLSLPATQSANSLLGRLPDPPSGPCEFNGDAERAYLDRIGEVSRDIDAALKELREVQEAHVQKNRARWQLQMADQATKQAGLTDAQAARVKSGRPLSKAEKTELADQVLQHTTNMSLAEARNLKNMDPAARKAWAQAYAAEMMATAQAKPPEERAADQKEQDRLMRLATLTKEQQDHLKRTNAEATALQQKMLELDSKAQELYARTVAPIDKRLEQCQEDINKASEAKEDERIAPLIEKRRQLQHERNVVLKAYCAQFSPPYAEIIRQYLTWAKGAQQGLNRYEEMENEKFKLQTNSPDNVLIAQVGTVGMGAAHSCAGLLASVFKYRLFSEIDDMSVQD